MNILVTGGAGFIGRWVVKQLIDDNQNIWVLDDFSNGSIDNLIDLLGYSNLNIIKGDIKDSSILQKIFKNKIDICYHLAASINVQDSLDDPESTFNNDVIGTFNVLQECKRNNTKIVFMSTCMVYDMASGNKAISESHPTKPASPYAGSKLSGENMVLSYWYGYGLPVVIVRPFNTYGPYQKASGEGGVVSIFIKKKLSGETLSIYGDGKQTRDLLYVEDCARFVALAGYSELANGHIINAGLGYDVSINDLAEIIAGNQVPIEHVPHIHPQSEISKLLCDFNKAEDIIGWYPMVSLEEGLQRTEEWIKNNTK